MHLDEHCNLGQIPLVSTRTISLAWYARMDPLNLLFVFFFLYFHHKRGWMGLARLDLPRGVFPLLPFHTSFLSNQCFGFEREIVSNRGGFSGSPTKSSRPPSRCRNGTIEDRNRHTPTPLGRKGGVSDPRTRCTLGGMGAGDTDRSSTRHVGTDRDGCDGSGACR